MYLMRSCGITILDYINISRYIHIVNYILTGILKMLAGNEKSIGNQALKRFLVINKLETGEENKQFALRVGVGEQNLYKLINGTIKRATKRVAKDIVEASKGRCSVELTMKDMGWE
jgi:hypothetical protein